jgi:hypothetical protein
MPQDPFRGPVELNAGDENIHRGGGFNSNPFSNPSPATRRPGKLFALAIFTQGNPITDNSAEAPPSYTEAVKTPAINVQSSSPTRAGNSHNRSVSPTLSGNSAISNSSIQINDDDYAFLAAFDTIFLIDDSLSMDKGSKWREVREVLRVITPICTTHDSDGIDVYFLKAKNKSRDANMAGGFTGVKTLEQVHRLFEQVCPSGGTLTGMRLDNILRPYIKSYREAINLPGRDPANSGVKPINIIVITDGEAQDDPEQIIKDRARDLDNLEAPRHQVGIQFFQIGKDDEAKDALKNMDDGLVGVRDMVDTVTYLDQDGGLTADLILKTVLGGVNRKLDNKKKPAKDNNSNSSSRTGRDERQGRNNRRRA